MAPGMLGYRDMRPNCHISERVRGCCDVCGNWPNRLHMPEELHGWYCAQCCPACNPKVVRRPVAAEQQEPAQQAA